MSKQSAMNMILGEGSPAVSASLITGDMPTEAPSQPTDKAVDAKPAMDSDRFAAFAKRESQLQKDREEVKRQREEILKEKESLGAVKKRASDFDEAWKKNKVEALRMLGATDEDIINIMAETQKSEETPEDRARKIAQEEADKIRAELRTEKEQLTKSQNDRLVNNLKSDIGEKIKANAEKYEYCAFEGPAAEVQAFEIIKANLKENNELLTVDQALEIAEEFYETRDKAMAALKKRQPKVEAKAEEPAPVQRSRTITNQVSPTATSMVQRRETPSEKRSRLENALRAGIF